MNNDIYVLMANFNKVLAMLDQVGYSRVDKADLLICLANQR